MLKDVTHQELRLLLTFVYTGTVNLPEGRVERFLEAGRNLQIEGIAGDTRLVHLGSANLLTAGFQCKIILAGIIGQPSKTLTREKVFWNAVRRLRQQKRLIWPVQNLIGAGQDVNWRALECMKRWRS